MPFEISVGPAQLVINVGECVMLTEMDGQIRQPSDRGLYYRDTRLLSEWRAEVDGRPWHLTSSAVTSHFAAQIILVNPSLQTDGADVPAGTVSLTISRMLDRGGMRETLQLRNYNRTGVRLALAIRFRCDFADIFDVRNGRLIQRGETSSSWSDSDSRLETVHSNGTFRRGISVCPVDGFTRPRLRDGTLLFTVDLAPQGTWQSELLYQVVDGAERLEASQSSYAGRDSSPQAEALRCWHSQAIRLSTPCTRLQRLYEQSVDDLAALRLPIEGTDPLQFVPAAGIPWFAALFGRDSLIAAMQTVAVYPDFARGALDVLARFQANDTDDSRDMQPGKIPHELRRGELAELGLVPYRPYYGSADATPLYIILLHQVWRSTADRALLERHIGTAERCCRWIEQFGDLDGDGFQEYQCTAPQDTRYPGAENQGWKDAENGILYEDGSDVPAPKAICELQGYVYAAWLGMAAIYDALNRTADAAVFRDKAHRLFVRFNAAFWDEEQQAYALCLDPAKRRVMTNTSNAGHLLWSGIVPAERAEAVVRRLLAPDMWSGWGVRTLSAAHPAYNPHDYQVGAVWPHDNAIIALGFKQYGFHAEAAQIVGGMVEAGCRFLLHRLPEVFAGTSRDDSPFPIQYLGANVPQAWAAGSVFFLLRALFGPEIDVGNGVLSLDPFLPDWLPEVTITGLRVGERKVDVRLWSENNETKAALVGGEGVRLVRRPAAGGNGTTGNQP